MTNLKVEITKENVWEIIQVVQEHPNKDLWFIVLYPTFQTQRGGSLYFLYERTIERFLSKEQLYNELLSAYEELKNK